MKMELVAALSEAMTESLAKGVTDEAWKAVMKKVNEIVVDIEGDLEWRVKQDLAPNLVAFVEEMATKVIEALLEGNEAEMRRYLGCDQGGWTSRSDSVYYGRVRDISEWHPVIHGKLFEHGGLALRKKIVEAHRDLIASERIKDLEDQVSSLVAQVNKERAEAERIAQFHRDRIQE